MMVQAVVDHNYLFRDICVGWPGSVHDARVFSNSLIYKQIMEQNLLENRLPRNIWARKLQGTLLETLRILWKHGY